MDVTINVIARMRSDFPTKFGIPRQPHLVQELRSTIVFEPEYRNADALRGIEGFSHLWIIWQFSEAVRSGWSPTVRPPRLGGNTRMGVFATRSPFRPNNLGLSCVKLLGVELRCGPHGRHSHFRHQALHPLCRQPSRGPWGLHRHRRGIPAGGRFPQPSAGASSRRKACCHRGCSQPRPPAQLSAQAGKSLRPALCGL